MAKEPPVREDPDAGYSTEDITLIPKYSASSTYVVGRKVCYGNAVYKCITAIAVPEQWTPEKWQFMFTISESSSGGGGSYSTKTCKLIIKYNKNGASGTPPSDQTVTYSGEKKKVTLKRTVQGQGGMTWDNHYFLGWSTTNNAAEGDIYPGYIEKWTWAAEESGTKTITLYAVWSAYGRIVYKPGQYANEASQIWHDRYQGIPQSGNVTLKGSIFTRKGYTVTGWMFNDEYFADINARIPVSNLSPEMELYPKWEPKTYTMRFKDVNASGETISEIPIYNVAFDSTVTIPGSDAFEKEGYHISLWNEAKDGTGGVWFPGKTYLYNIDRDNITLFAQWSGNEYRVLYCQDEETASQTTPLSVVCCPSIGLNNDSEIVSVSEDYTLALDSNDILTFNPANTVLDTTSVEEYSIATYGSPFYTDFRPKPKDNYSFDGWMSTDGIRFTKKDVWMDAYSLAPDATWTRMSDIILYPIWSEKYPYGKVFFGRKESSDYGIIITDPPSYYWPEHPYTHKNVKGKNGDIITDSKYYKNVTKKYDIAAYDKNDVVLSARNVSDFLHRYNGHDGYIRLEDSYEPDVYMRAVYEEFNELKSVLGQAWKTTLEFSCKPQKFLLSGDRRVNIIQSGTEIYNPTDYPALPIIIIWGTGDIHFSGRPTKVLNGEKVSTGNYDEAEVKDVLLTIYNNYNQITIDAETFDAEDVNGDNVNSSINLEDQIVLYPGSNSITFAGEIEKISIIPRWWRL